jgi:hypothetical protein
MNTYRINFDAVCPVNGDLVAYELVIESTSVLSAEQLREACDGMDDNLHEQIADKLVDQFRGVHILTATHRGVHIQTTRLK